MLLALVSFYSVFAQNLEKIGDKDFIKINGALNFNTVNYFVSGMESRRDPFTWFATGTLNINVLDVAIPLTYSYSNLGGKFTQPFNQFGLHPTYKWIKTHVGYHSMTFSNYTLAGHLFLGGGVELTPGKWNIMAMGGRLNKPIQYNAVDDNENQIVYQRYGYGVKGGYKTTEHEIALTLFKAFDQNSSLVFIPANSTVKPQDNLVASLNGRTTLYKNIFVEGELAYSVLTSNTRSEVEQTTNPFQGLKGLMQVNATTTDYMAYKTSLGYKFTKWNLAANYEHVDNGYTTLGGYFFNNDLENYTLSANGILFKDKVNMGVNTGFQYNNLDGNKAATTKRLVGSLNLAIRATQKLNITTSYSNFSNFTRNRLQSDPFYTPLGDTLNFYNQNQAASISVNQQLGGQKIKQQVQVLFNYNQSTNVSGGFNSGGIYGINAPQGVPVQVYVGNAIYSMQFTQQKMGLSVGGNANYSQLPTGDHLFAGGLVNVNKALGKYVSATAGTVYNRQYIAGVFASNVFNHRLSLTYKASAKKTAKAVQLKPMLSLNAAYLQKLPVVDTEKTIHEVNVFVNLGLSF